MDCLTPEKKDHWETRLFSITPSGLGQIGIFQDERSNWESTVDP